MKKISFAIIIVFLLCGCTARTYEDGYEEGYRSGYSSAKTELEYQIDEEWYDGYEFGYEEGYYESLVIYIGEAKGDNWWCVLFPNLCLIDLENKSENEYKSWVIETINKIF